MNYTTFLLLCFIGWSNFLYSQVQDSTKEIREFLDLQIHPTMHVPYSMFGKGLEYFDTTKPPKLKYKHQLKNVNYANFLKGNKGARIIINGALTNDNIKSKKKARRMILKQIDYVNNFAARDSHFVVAKSPAEVRKYVEETNKTIILHSIEGARKVINNQDDAVFWAKQGVAFVTIMHLVDHQLGSAAIKPGFMPGLINFKGLWRKKKKRGLKPKGKQVMEWLANAGIMIDLTHMSGAMRTQTLDFMEERNIPPLATHDVFKPIQNSPRGIPANEIARFYELGGMVSLPISGESLKAFKTEDFYQQQMDSLHNLGCYCDGSIHSYQFTYLALKQHIEASAETLKKMPFKDLSEKEKVAFSIGMQSDFNGWLNHHKPIYGKKGCYPIEEGKVYDRIELDGMPHPGYMIDHWQWLEKQGVDIEPVKRSSERFLQLWEYFLENRIDALFKEEL